MTRILKPYTDAEIATMRKLAAAGKSQPQIAEFLDRTSGSVAAALAKHGIRTFGESGNPHPERAHKAFTAQDDAMIRGMVAAECDAEQIATVLNRSVGSLRNYCARVGIDIPASRRTTAVATFRASALDRWPAWARFEDDPKAPKWEPPWKAPPIMARSPIGSAAAMCAGIGA